ncbi:UNKNOWN [Stylonychia lemnae]|uniref:Acyltransferase 3 domain-containing protein n=1 Tax=Stylonychia lemnae TaxID=5949 RepID=A0A078ASX5_STYLE|nr:UNKNOWN [Stylonychia lemnae]|eukprot:CDW84312.1 UNKNOWN [Stylonychia lemnae]
MRSIIKLQIPHLLLLTILVCVQIYYSGKYFNDLGQYRDCQESDGLQYTLAVAHKNAYELFDYKQLWAFCLPSKCKKTELIGFNQFLNSSLKTFNSEASKIEYVFSKQDLESTRSSQSVGFYTLIGFFVLSALLGIFGIVIEYTSVGSTQLSQEDTNFNTIDIPMVQDGTTMDQLRQIMMIKDELLRNSKRLWASIILSFSFTRNLRLLFYKFKIQQQQMRHRNALYLILAYGILWYTFFSSTMLGILMFPKNFQQISIEISGGMYLLFHGGQLFGMNMIFLASGYIIVISLFESSTFRPSRFQDLNRKKRNSIAPIETEGNEESSQKSFYENNNSKGNIKLKEEEEELIEGKYQIKRRPFMIVARIFRRYLRFFIPLLFTTLSILYVLPFLSSGPIYLVAFRYVFQIPCEGSWYLNFLFVQNLMYWTTDYDKSKCYPYFTDGVLATDESQAQVTKISDSSCAYQCGPYLQMFSNQLQFFLIVPLILYLHKYFRKISYCLVIFNIICSIAVTFLISFNQDIQAYVFVERSYVSLLLNRPWFRYSSFQTGVLLGMIVGRIHILKINIAFKRKQKLGLYLTGMVLCFVSLITLQLNNGCFDSQKLLYEQQGCFSKFEAALYNAIAPQVFNFGLILLILPAILALNNKNSQNFSLRMILTYEGWRVFYKLATTIYISHFMVIFWYYGSISQTGYLLSEWVIFRVANGAVVLSTIIGFVFYLLIDKPFRNIDKMVLFPTKISDSFLIKKNQKGKKISFEDKLQKRGGASPNKANDGPGYMNGSNIAEHPEELNTHTQGSDESEDETTVTFRKAAKYRDKNQRDENLYKISRGDSLYYPGSQDKQHEVYMIQNSNDSSSGYFGTQQEQIKMGRHNAINKSVSDDTYDFNQSYLEDNSLSSKVLGSRNNDEKPKKISKKFSINEEQFY